MYKFIAPLGIATYVLLLLTIISGYMIYKMHIKWVKMSMHMGLAILTLILASMHAGIIIFGR